MERCFSLSHIVSILRGLLRLNSSEQCPESSIHSCYKTLAYPIENCLNRTLLYCVLKTYLRVRRSFYVSFPKFRVMLVFISKIF